MTETVRSLEGGLTGLGICFGTKSLDLTNVRNVIGAAVGLLDTGVGRDTKTSDTAALHDAAGDRLC